MKECENMLKIYLGNMEKSIYHPPAYFDNQYEDEWMTNDLTIQMIKDIFRYYIRYRI